jgi:cytochrome c-type biogenesis protein CcmH
MRFFLLVCMALLVLGAPARAVEPAERLADPVLEGRARALSQGLRCLVCQNESIDESGADLAHDVRVMLRERLAAGDSDAQAVAYIVARYGEFVLMQPPVRSSTYVLWFAPPLILAAGGAGLLLARRRTAALPPPPPLDAAEQARLAKLLADDAPAATPPEHAA